MSENRYVKLGPQRPSHTTCQVPFLQPANEFAALVCDSCHTLHSAEDLDHFRMLGLEPDYDVDATDVRQRYLQLSREVHPDHHAVQTAESLKTSAGLNEAYRVIRDDVLRAEYLLELHGGEASTGDKTVAPDVLATTLMLREEIAEAHAADDANALATLRQQVDQRRSAALTQIASLAHQLPGDEDVRKQLRAALNAMKYYHKLAAEI